LWIVMAMLALNWVIASRASVDHQRITVRYSYFWFGCGRVAHRLRAGDERHDGHDGRLSRRRLR
jgi:hypothetical protein